MVEVLHQLGFRYKWNLTSLGEDGAGDGVICAPRYMHPDAVTSISADIRAASCFDPQFYVPDSSKGYLLDYNFFPKVVADGFSTTDYSEEHAQESAARCLRFQAEQGFNRLIIPTRHREATPSDFIESQWSMFVQPFLKAAAEEAHAAPLLLQLILNDAMIKDGRFRNSILNWVTGLSEISGVYLIPQHMSRQKQIMDIDYLLALLSLIKTIRANNMDIVIGYVNTEAVPLLVADPSAVTIGGYENLRMFSLKAFENDDGGVSRGPAARIYVSRLLQWINHEYLGAIRRVVDDVETFFDDSKYRVSMFEPRYNWHFAKPEPYKHYFSVFAKQLKRIGAVPMSDRIAAARQECEQAIAEYRELERLGIVFDTESAHSHLGPWITAINIFERELGAAG